jgi:hypothetical protein
MIRPSPAVSMRPGFAAPMFDRGLNKLTKLKALKDREDMGLWRRPVYCMHIRCLCHMALSYNASWQEAA